MRDGLDELNSSVLSKMMSNNEMEEASLKTNINIMNAFKEDEMDDYLKIRGSAKTQIIMLTSCTMADIATLLKQYEGFKNIHTWLHTLEAKNLPMPKSQGELIERYRNDQFRVKSPYFKERNRKPKYSKKSSKPWQ